jgi:UMF1 family MFS transporter
MGYLGSVVLLIINLAMIMSFDDPAMQSTMTKWSFVSVGLWWIGFAQITFKVLPKETNRLVDSESLFKRVKSQLSSVVKIVKSNPQMKKYLFGFFFFSMGVQTIMYLATLFGEDVVDLKTSELIILVLILQLVAVPGSFLFAKISSKKGNIFTLMVTLVLWFAVCIAAFMLKEGMKTEFYIIGAVVGLLMGGTQSLARSTYAKYIPNDTEDHASFFSFYETVEKIAIALGTFVYGFVAYLTNNMNLSALSLGIFFIIGFLFLMNVNRSSSVKNPIQE